MHAFEHSLAEDYIVRIILPEGSTDIRLELPQNFNIDKYEMSKFFGTLDFFGRPMLTLHKKDAVHELLDHNLRVHYKFNNQWDFYLEPIMVFIMFFSLFILAILYSRMEFNWENVQNREKQM